MPNTPQTRKNAMATVDKPPMNLISAKYLFSKDEFLEQHKTILGVAFDQLCESIPEEAFMDFHSLTITAVTDNDIFKGGVVEVGVRFITEKEFPVNAKHD